MAKQFPEIGEDHRAFIEAQPLFFTGTAAASGRVNVSPKGRDSLRILSPSRVIWRNLTGSGNESAAHVEDISRMTLMWCSFSTRPLILRVYGTARAVHRGDADWAALDAQFEPDFAARQIFDVAVEMVQTSCGYAVPFMDAPRPRDTLVRWAEDKGPEGIRAYWAETTPSPLTAPRPGSSRNRVADAATVLAGLEARADPARAADMARYHKVPRRYLGLAIRRWTSRPARCGAS